MPATTYFLDAWSELEDGTRVHPYTGLMGEKKGLYSVNFTNDNRNFEGVTDGQLRSMFETGRFVERGTIRMMPLNATPGVQRNAFAPTHYRGSRISKQIGSSPSNHNTLHPNLFAGEVPDGHGYFEGALKLVTVNAFERSSAARTACLLHHGYSCQVCQLNFEQRYGEVGKNFIHVHHVVRLADIASEYKVDPIRDLVPVCPNCHAMLHQTEPPMSISELRSKLREA